MTTTTNNRIRFMDNNLGELTTASIMKSSQLSAFPVSNINNKFRSKVWRPDGYFLITLDSNDLLYINDGSDKTVTITAGEYNPTTLATEIQTQLNTVSSGWTFDYNNTAGEFSFRFAHASGHTLRFSQQTEALWADLGFVLTTDEVISTERIADEPRNHMYEFVQWDLGYNAPVEFFGVISPLGEEFTLSVDATIKIQANNLSDFTSPPLDVTLTRQDQGLFRFFDDIADTGYRFWRFYFEDKTNTGGPEGFEFSYIYLGDYTTLTGTNIQNGFRKRIVDPSLRTTSEQGQIYFDRKTKYSEFTSAGIALLTKGERDTLEQLFYDFGTHTPLFVSLDPALCISDELGDFTKYVIFDREPEFRHVRHQYFNMTLQLREVL